MQNRFTSPVAWATLLPVLVLLGDTYGLWEVIRMPQDVFAQVFTGILAILVAFGIFNNPTDAEHF